MKNLFVILGLFVFLSAFSAKPAPETCMLQENQVDPSQLRYPAIDREGEIFFCFHQAAIDSRQHRDLAAEGKKSGTNNP